MTPTHKQIYLDSLLEGLSQAAVAAQMLGDETLADELIDYAARAVAQGAKA